MPTAPIQLILFNGSKKQVVPYLNETVHHRKWRNKTYIFGYTVSRDRFRPSHREILNAENDTENEIFIYLRSEVQNSQIESLKKKGGVLYDRAKAADDKLSKGYFSKRKCNFTNATGDLEEDCNSKLPFTSWMSYVATATELFKYNLEEILVNVDRSMVDIFELRQRLFDSLESGIHNVQIYGQSLENIKFERSTLAMGFQVIEYGIGSTNDSETFRGRVMFDQSAEQSLSANLKENIAEIGGTKSCSLDCAAGTHIVLMSHSSGLSKCWTCYNCADNSISGQTNAKQCSKCEESEIAVDGNTACKPVPSNFISLWSMEFVVGLTLSTVAGVITVTVAMFLFYHRNRPIIKASDSTFCFLFLSSLCLGDILTVTALFEPSTHACNVELFICSAFVCCVCSNLFYRSLKIYKIFATAVEFQLRRPFIFKFLTKSMQIIFLVLMMGITASLTAVTILQNGWTYEQNLNPHRSIDKVCTSSDFIATCLPFTIPCMMLAATLFIAYKMRLFPHNFKETTTIFTTCLIIVVICLMFLSGYSISEPSLKSMLRAIVYFCITQCLLFCIFFPKILILWKKDDLIDADGGLSHAIRSYCEITEKRASMIEAEKREREMRH